METRPLQPAASINPDDPSSQRDPSLEPGADERVPSVTPHLVPAAVLNPALAANTRYQLRALQDASLSADRAISIYLPVAYFAEPDRRFPVFYLQDGQNLFDGMTSYLPGHTWRAHSTADRLTEIGCIEPIILVGVANAGDQRMPEYTPVADPQLGGGRGPLYGRLLLDTLKPLIDEEFRTLPDAPHTALGGSSLGGLISLFLALEHRDRIGRIAVLSPSLWWNGRSILRLARRANIHPPLSIWLDIGTAEGSHHLRDSDLLFSILVDRGWEEGRTLVYQRVLGGLHNEDAWADRFGDILAFLFPADRPAILES